MLEVTGMAQSLRGPEQPKQGMVTKAIERLSGEVRDLHDTISRLEQDLDIVRMPRSSKDQGEAKEKAIAVPLAEAILSVVDSVREANYRLTKLHNELEI